MLLNDGAVECAELIVEVVTESFSGPTTVPIHLCLDAHVDHVGAKLVHGVSSQRFQLCFGHAGHGLGQFRCFRAREPGGILAVRTQATKRRCHDAGGPSRRAVQTANPVASHLRSGCTHGSADAQDYEIVEGGNSSATSNRLIGSSCHEQVDHRIRMARNQLSAGRSVATPSALHEFCIGDPRGVRSAPPRSPHQGGVSALVLPKLNVVSHAAQARRIWRMAAALRREDRAPLSGLLGLVHRSVCPTQNLVRSMAIPSDASDADADADVNVTTVDIDRL